MDVVKPSHKTLVDSFVWAYFVKTSRVLTVVAPRKEEQEYFEHFYEGQYRLEFKGKLVAVMDGPHWISAIDWITRTGRRKQDAQQEQRMVTAFMALLTWGMPVGLLWMSRMWTLSWWQIVLSPLVGYVLGVAALVVGGGLKEAWDDYVWVRHLRRLR